MTFTKGNRSDSKMSAPYPGTWSYLRSFTASHKARVARRVDSAGGLDAAPATFDATATGAPKAGMSSSRPRRRPWLTASTRDMSCSRPDRDASRQ